MKKYLFGTILALICVNTTMNGDNYTQRAELDLHIPRLKKLAISVSDAGMKKQLQEVLEYAHKVSSSGKEAKKESLAKAIGAVHRAISFINEKNQAKRTSLPCDLCDELYSFEEELAASFIEAKAELYKLLDFLDSKYPTSSSITIQELPATVSEAGIYYLSDDLVHASAGAAITITADDIVLDCKNHSISLNHEDGEGIIVQGAKDFTLKNCHILGSQAKTAVSLVNVSKASIDNFYGLKTRKGISLQNCQNVAIENSHFELHDGTELELGAGLLIDNSESISLTKSHFEGSGASMDPDATSNALLITGKTQNVFIKDSSFSNWLSTLTINEVCALHIDNCSLVGSPISNKNLIELGTITSQANDVQITNTRLIQKKAKTGFDGMLFLNGQGARLENIILDITTTGDDYKPSAIHIGCKNNGSVSCTPGLLYSDIEAKSCKVVGSFPYALHIENGSYISFSESTFANGTISTVFMDNARSCIVKDSTIQNGTSGITISQNAHSPAIIGCEISGNDQNGITISQNSIKAFVVNNRIFGNGGYGLVDNEATTVTHFNTICKNNKNCLGVHPAQPPGTSPQTAGSNLCGTP